MFLPHPRVKVSIVGSLRDREVACSASDRQGSNFESCVWRTVSSQSSHHPQEVLLAQFSLYVHKGGLKPDSFHFHHTQLPVFLHHTHLAVALHYTELSITPISQYLLFTSSYPAPRISPAHPALRSSPSHPAISSSPSHPALSIS